MVSERSTEQVYGRNGGSIVATNLMNSRHSYFVTEWPPTKPRQSAMQMHRGACILMFMRKARHITKVHHKSTHTQS